MTLEGDPSESTPVLVEVFRSVLASVGVTGEASERLLNEVMNERRKSADSGQSAADASCTLRFAAHAGQIEISLSQDGRSFRTSCPVPIR